MTITPIETRYAGHRFRSRLEARWARFFDALGIAWEYEPQGYTVNGRAYLPDFRIKALNQRVVVEVKGENERLDLKLLADFVESDSQTGFALVLGAIPPDSLYTHTHVMLHQPVGYFPADSEPDRVNMINELLAPLPEEHRFTVWNFITAQSARPASLTLAAFFGGWGKPFIGPMSYLAEFVEGFDGLDPLAPPAMPILADPNIRAAYTAARSARFEHGEEG